MEELEQAKREKYIQTSPLENPQKDLEAQQEGGQSIVNQFYCKKHKKEATQLCINDLKPICQSCLNMKKHKFHTIIDVQEQEEIVQGILDQKLITLTQNTNDYQQIIGQKEQQIEQLKTKKKQVLQEVQDKIQTLMHKITQIQQIQVNQIDFEFEEAINSLNVTVQEGSQSVQKMKQMLSKRKRNNRDQLKNLKEIQKMQKEFTPKYDDIHVHLKNKLQLSKLDKIDQVVKDCLDYKVEISKNSFQDFYDILDSQKPKNNYIH